MGTRGPIADPNGARARKRARQTEAAPVIPTGCASVPSAFSPAQAEAWHQLVAAMKSVGRDATDFDAPLLDIAARSIAFEQELERKVIRATYKKGQLNPVFPHLDRARKRTIELLDKLGLTTSSHARITGKAIGAAQPGQGMFRAVHATGGEVYLDDLESQMCGDLPS